jgi:trk system potassium uptake protein TrkA
MKVILVGGGQIGETLSRILVKEKHDVVLVERDESLAEELAERTDALILNGDGSDKSILRDANIESADSVIALTGDDKTNISVCQFAKEMKVKNIISRINQQESENEFSKFGIANTVDATTTSALAFKKLMEKPGKQLISFVAGGKGEIFELSVKKESKMCGKEVGEFSKNFTVACIYRDDKYVIPAPGARIREGDILTICAPLEEIRKIEGMI